MKRSIKNPWVALLTLVAVVFTFGVTGPIPALAVTGTIQVNSVVINDNGGTRTADSFDLFVREASASDGTFVVSGETNTFAAPATYFVSATGDANYTRSFSGNCDADGMIDLAIGDAEVCTVTNDDIGEDTGGSDTTPDAFTFVDATGVDLSTTIGSNVITVAGIDAAADISVTGGEYSINGGTYTSVAGTVVAGDTVTVQHTSSDTNSTAVDTTLTIGGISDTFTSTTIADGGDPGSGDSEPGVFVFVDQFGVELDTVVESDPITVEGIDTAADISVTGGEYSINGGAYTSTAGTVEVDDTITVRGTSASTNSTAVDVVLTIGGVSDTFTIMTTAAEPTGEEGTIQVNKVVINDDGGTRTANSFDLYVIPAGTDTGVLVINGETNSFVEGSYRISETGDPNYTFSFSGDCDAGGNLDLAADETLTCTITNNDVGDGGDTGDSDTTPDAFTFTDELDVELNTTIESNEITVTGIDAAADISVTGGEYSINGGDFTSDEGTVDDGDTVVVRHTSADTEDTDTNTTLTIGGVSDTFSSTTLDEGDPNNDGEGTIRVTKVVVNDDGGTMEVSDFDLFVTLSGEDTGTNVISGETNEFAAGTYRVTETGNPFYEKSFSGDCDSDGFIFLDEGEDAICILTNDDGADGDDNNNGGTDTTPNAFSFIDQTGVATSTEITSNSITVTGINAPADISVTGGQYSINGTGTTTDSGVIHFGDTVRVHHTSSSATGTSVHTTLTIGGVSDTFTSTTIGTTTGTTTPDTTPDAFTFVDQTGVALNTVIESNAIMVAGISGTTTISVSGGEYSINGAGTTTASGTVSAGDVVRVRHTSSNSNSTSVHTTLTIGGVSDTFTSTTLASATNQNGGRSRSRGTTINQSVVIGGNNSGTINVIGQVLGFASDEEREAQIIAVRSQLVTLITQLIGLLQIQIANANAQQQ